jgi:uncharacterized protein YbbC (DUF1343 family)
MMRAFLKFSFLFFTLNLSFSQGIPEARMLSEKDVVVGAARFQEYIPKLAGKRVGVIANLTSKVGNSHLIDTLIKLGVNVKKIFGPEHGFRGDSDAGEKVNTGIDSKTGLPLISLYGKHNKPTREDLRDLDILLYDIQDVGVRFYTYISTMSYAMEACAENKKKLIILDRPNPNGFYVDGPVLDPLYKSFLGLHPVPVVYGMTCGEYALMVNGEKWLNKGLKCDVEVISVLNYTHADYYQLPERPSPNLPNMMSVYMYPSLGLFEGTIVSMGRGTAFPFQVIGHPKIKESDFSFTPQSNAGAKNPKYQNQVCYGYDLRRFGEDYLRNLKQLNLLWLSGMYQSLKGEGEFFDANFNFHAGNNLLQEQIKKSMKENDISSSWKNDIKKFKLIRSKYLLYKDFE